MRRDGIEFSGKISNLKFHFLYSPRMLIIIIIIVVVVVVVVATCEQQSN